jgi:hypothetical protein
VFKSPSREPAWDAVRRDRTVLLGAVLGFSDMARVKTHVAVALVAMRQRSQLLGPDSTPVSLPSSDYDRSKVRTTGVVELPLHIRWSGPALTYDLGDRRDLSRVYEQVLREGTSADIQEFIDDERWTLLRRTAPQPSSP